MLLRGKNRDILEKIVAVNEGTLNLIRSGRYNDRLRIVRKEFVDAVYYIIIGDREKALKHINEAEKELAMIREEPEIS